MRITELFGSITPAQIKQMILDFKRLFPGDAASAAESRSIFKTLGNMQKYRIVAKAMVCANFAARKGEQELYRFMQAWLQPSMD